MPQVQTVRGPVDTADLGTTLMHEHVFVLNADIQQNYPEEWGSEDDRIADAVQRLTKLAGVGVRTIVDPTVWGLGRYIPRIQRIAAQVDVAVGAKLAAALKAQLAACAATTGVRVVLDETTGAGFSLRLDGGRVEHDFSEAAIAAALAKRLRPDLAKLVRG